MFILEQKKMLKINAAIICQVYHTALKYYVYEKLYSILVIILYLLTNYWLGNYYATTATVRIT